LVDILVVDCYFDPTRSRRQIRQLRNELLKAGAAAVSLTRFDIFATETHRDVDGLVLSGTEITLSRKDIACRFDHLAKALTEYSIPVLGVCGGHQLIGLASGSRISPLGKRIKGFKEVMVHNADEIFQGLPSKIIVAQSHREHVTELPEGFILLASSLDTRIEAMKSSRGPIYGIQFHPERYDANHPDGLAVLQNFISLCRR
jgi:GMP synthase-like glutamine amidotransferase